MSKQGIPSGALGMYPESKHLPNLNPGGCGVESTSPIPQKQLRKRVADCKHGFESRWGHHLVASNRHLEPARGVGLPAAGGVAAGPEGTASVARLTPSVDANGQAEGSHAVRATGLSRGRTGWSAGDPYP